MVKITGIGVVFFNMKIAAFALTMILSGVVSGQQKPTMG